MKRFLALTLSCLLLCGCTPKTTASEIETETQATTIQTIPETQPAGVYDPGDPREARYQGDLRVYPLQGHTVAAMQAMGDDLLILSGGESTTLTLLTGESLHAAAETTLSFWLDPASSSLQITEDWLSYFDPSARETVVLDKSLKVVSRIAAPEGISGAPILSSDRNTLFYCTSVDIRAWDLESGIRRCVKEMSFDSQTVTGIHLNDTVLQCTIGDDGSYRTILLSVDTGRLLYEGSEDMTLTTQDSRYIASLSTGSVRALVFGEQDGTVQALTPTDLTSESFLLPQQNAVVTVSNPSSDSTQLEYYDLNTGLRRSVLTLDGFLLPSAIEGSGDDAVYILVYDPSADCDTIFRWDLSADSSLLINDGTVYTGHYYTAAEPDYNGLSQCRAYAADIGSRYGISVLVWEDALALQPWDYNFEAEYLVPVLQRELEKLDTQLGKFPDGFLETTAGNFSSLTICLVRTLTGSAESGSLDTATGIQFFDDADAYIALAAGDTLEKTLYHELYHVMETQILNESIALDQWSKLNPVGFEYDYDYIANASRDGSEYLQPDTRSFVDAYSMSFPKEDRARIFEYAMTADNEALFAASPLQYKLRTLCEGIREAYGLEKSPEAFPWEQYLVKSLAYTG